ncbi:hypothetical protein Mal64_20040 [Pseudobythopirellula maris]|uniref:PEP-CTERM protein-sorting domain-containing protein n=1 Tax=Pseudobythopirellula maris TaxID=2527991 RepID=A0A5C5ZP23_9BACT|nr:hypothetical protein [Pseudobythopirellula maris]TWT88521.1 hypothetical protein Mal64_20040 [Pseudobythopirellula maris]
MKKIALTFCALLALAAPARAAFDLQITEIWPGNEPGSNLTDDWFEVTNYGDMAWVAATDGDLYFDDESQDVGDASILAGVASIAPGESAVFVDTDDLTEFYSVWSNLQLWQVGTHGGKGLGQGGDGVTLFLSTGVPTGIENIIDFEVYPDAELNGGQSYDVTLGAFSTVGNANGASMSAVANDEGQFAIASIGVPVPEPTAALLAALATCGLAVARRR